VFAQVIVPQIVLSKVASSLVGLYAVPVLAADVGMGISVAVCMNPSTQAKFDSDADLRSFCSTATNWSSYELMKSRAKGFVSGKKSKERLLEWNEKRKEKRSQRQAGRLAQRAN
jgi:hypothetical protein